MKKREGNAELIAFEVDKPEWFEDYFQQVCKACEIIFISSVPDEICKAEERGARIDGKPDDVHWNDVGTRLPVKLYSIICSTKNH